MQNPAAEAQQQGLSPASRGQALDWLSSTNNASARAMAMAALGIHVQPHLFGSHPRTPEDVGWCIVLLRRCPDLRQHLDKVAATSPAWKRVIANWPALEDAYIADFQGNRPGGTAERYAATIGQLNSCQQH